MAQGGDRGRVRMAECPGKGAVLQGPLLIQLGHPRIEAKADAPVYVDSLVASLVRRLAP